MTTPMSPTAAYFPRPTFPSHRHKSANFIAIAGSPCCSACKSFLNSRRRLIRRTRNCRATPAGRDSLVSFAQNFHHPGNLRNPQKRPPPPDFARQRHRRIRPAVSAPVAQKKLHFSHQLLARQSQQRTDARILQRRQRHPAPLQIRRNPSRDPCAELALRVKKQPPSRVPPLPVRVLTHQRNHCRPSSLFSFLSVLCELCALCAISFSPFFRNFQLLAINRLFPQQRITFPRSFTTPFSAPVGIRIISSNNPVIAVKNSSILSSRSRVYASPWWLDFTSHTHSASTFSVGSISRRFRSSETIRKISHTSLIDSKWSRRSPSTCTTRTIRHPCNSRRLVLTFERATASVAEISSAGSGCGDRNSSACTCATVRLMPQRVPISPQCKMNFWATGVKLFFVGSLIFALPCQASFLLLLSCLLFLLLQNIQIFPCLVKSYLSGAGRLGRRPLQ